MTKKYINLEKLRLTEQEEINLNTNIIRIETKHLHPDIRRRLYKESKVNGYTYFNRKELLNGINE